MEDLRIKRLVINKLGVFEHLDLSFEKNKLEDKAEIHIFTGENGTGKSTLLEALTFFDSVYNEYLRDDRKDIDNSSFIKKIWGDRKHPELGIGLYFEKRKLEFFNFGFNENIDDLNFWNLYYRLLQQEDIKDYHSYNFFAYNGHRQLRDTNVEVMKKIDFNPITEALIFDKTNTNVNLFQWIANNKTRAALAFQKGKIKDSENYLFSIQRIEKAIGEIIGKDISFILDEHLLNVMVKINDIPIYYNTLADGYKSIISWLTDLIFRLDYMPSEGKENFTLFLDEIDIHLHPAAQRRILPVIQKLFPKAQIFLTTHSPFIIGSIDGAWVYKFKLDEKGNSVLDGKPFLTEDAKSYRYILEQVFDINKQFGIEIEKRLDEFYKIRDEIIKNSTVISTNGPSVHGLTKIARELAVQSEELRAIMGNELKQLSRIIKKEITL
ncbi:MAG: AAA family ATPase [Bacteroidota bacterium]